MTEERVFAHGSGFLGLISLLSASAWWKQILSLAGSWLSLYQQHDCYDIWMHLNEKDSTGPISTQNVAQPQACDAAG